MVIKKLINFSLKIILILHNKKYNFYYRLPESLSNFPECWMKIARNTRLYWSFAPIFVIKLPDYKH